MALFRAGISALAPASKAANCCGRFIALRHYGRRYSWLTGGIFRLCLAVGFANYRYAANAAAIGLIVGFPPDRGL